MKNMLHYIKPSAALFITVILLTACSKGPVVPGKYASVAKCLTEKGVILYGAYWCPHCEEQKQAFGDDFQFVTYQECDDSGPNGNHKACLDAGVTSYPTWNFPGQGNLVGTNPIFVLAKLANCEDTLPAEDLQQLKDAEMAVSSSTTTATPEATGIDTNATTSPTSAPGETGVPETVGRVMPSAITETTTTTP